MKKMVRMMGILIVLGLSFSTHTTRAEAAILTPQGRLSYLNAKNFDGALYAATYPEVAAYVGTSNSALYKHYVNAGVYEGRVAWSKDPNTNAKLKAHDIATTISISSTSDMERAKAAHDWIVNNCTYDLAGMDMYYPNDHSAVGPLLYGTAVCEGYAKAYQLILDELGIPNRRVTGIADGGWHSWSEVCIGGITYAVDVTWDDPLPDVGGVRSYRYFMITKEQMAMDHVFYEYD